MVPQNSVRIYGVHQVFRFVEGIWLHRKGPFFSLGKALFYFIRAQHVLSYIVRNLSRQKDSFNSSSLEIIVYIWSIDQVFRLVEGIWLHRKIRPIRFFPKRSMLPHMCATCSELQSYISTME